MLFLSELGIIGLIFYLISFIYFLRIFFFFNKTHIPYVKSINHYVLEFCFFTYLFQLEHFLITFIPINFTFLYLSTFYF